MKVLIVNDKGTLSIEETTKPIINEYQALVKMIACGMCNGTDTKLIHGTFKGFTYDKDYPMMLGHEGVGRVEEIGAKVTGYKVGDIVMLPYALPNDGFKVGFGGYAQYGVVNDLKSLKEAGIAPESEMFPECTFAQGIVPADIDPVDAVLIVTFREVLSSVKTFGIGANNSVVVYGCGPVGVTFIKMMHLLGAHPIIALDIDETKLEAAKANGATHVFCNKNTDTTEKVRQICPDGVDYVVDAVGVLEIINEGFGLIKDRGTIGCYGISSKQSMQLDWSSAPYNWNICFQQMPRKEEEGETHTQILAWLRSGALNIKDYISDYVEFKDIIAAFDRLERGDIKLKCIIKF